MIVRRDKDQTIEAIKHLRKFLKNIIKDVEADKYAPDINYEMSAGHAIEYVMFPESMLWKEYHDNGARNIKFEIEIPPYIKQKID